LLLLIAFASFAFAGTAQAQSGEGVLGWTHGGGVYFPTAYEACRAKWQHWGMDNGYSRFIGDYPYEDEWTTRNCEWTRFQYLCPAETGGGLAQCWTILPGTVNFQCATGYTPTVDGHCRANPAVERPCNCEEDGRPNPTAGNPIVLSTGAKVLEALDYETADGRFTIGRHYRSFQVGRPIQDKILPRSSPRWLAGGWNLDFGYEIQLGTFSGSPSTPNATVAVLAPDGTGFGFKLQSNGQWIVDPSIGAANRPNFLKLEFVGTLPQDLATMRTMATIWKLTDAEDTVWTLRTRVGPNGGQYLYGWPTQKVARDGYTWNFTYNSDSSLASITDSFGRTATLTWHKFFISSLASPPGGSLPYPLAVKSIALPDGTSLRYKYAPTPAETAPSTSVLSHLVKVERLSATNAILDSVTYLYEDNRFRNHVTGITDNRGIRVSTYAYDVAGRAISTQGAGGANSHSVAYGVNGSARTRAVTNSLGKVETYTFSSFSGAGPADYRLTQVAGQASSNTPASSESIAYGSDTFVSSGTDAEGRLTTAARDARGRPTSIVEGSGTSSQRATAITWHSTFNVPVSLVRDGLTETRTYDANGQLETVTLTDTTSHSVPYSTNGEQRTWTYDWDSNGRLLSVNGPLAADTQSNDDITSFTYDTAGNLVTSTDALGHVATFDGHDANGRPGTMTDPNGVVTAFAYDPLGRVETVTAQHPTNPALNAVTTLAYDAIGQVTAMTLPSTDTLIMDYDDAGRLTAMRAASGERWDYAYDAEGNVTRETVKRGDGSTSLRITRAFDELSRVLNETVGTGHTSRWGYDKVGNVVSEISPNGHETTTAFDALDRLITTVAPDNGSTALVYDDSDNLTGHTDPISVTTEFVYNGFGEAIQEVSPDRGTSTYVYDAAGRVTQSSDGRGQVIDYTYDHLGRLTGKVPQGRPASEAIAYHWDTGGLSGSYEVGQLAKVVDGSGTTLFQYDHRGNMTAKEQAVGATGAAQLAYEYDLADRITQITYPSGRQVRYGYDGKGRVNLVETRSSAAAGSWTVVASGHGYEPFGAVAAMTLGNGLAVENAWGSDGLLASRRLFEVSSGTSLSHLSYRYDADGNLSAIDDQVTPANSAIYGYDEVGRLTLAVADGGSAGSQSYSYTSGTNRLAWVTDASGTRTIAYDDRGNTLSETRPGGVTAAAEYDGYGRLTGYDRTGVGASDFVYNGLDDRVLMALDTAGVRRFVYDADGRVMGEYGTSAADVKAEFIWALPQVGQAGPFGGDDGLGGYMPLAVATPDTTGMIQLNWVHGNHLGVPLVVTGAGGGLPITPNDYLPPGFPGQSRVFADLYYNRYRDYDPVTGRYIQADPIGLGGGSNPYLYAEANPVNLVDPDGKNPILIGALAWAVAELAIQAIGNWQEGKDIFDPHCYEWEEVAFAAATGAFGGGWVNGWVKMTRGSMKWNNVSRRIRRAEKLVGEDVDLHHWLIPKRFGGRPGGRRDRIINRPWNLKPLPRPFHRSVHDEGTIIDFIRAAPDAVKGAVAVGAAATAEELGDKD
jgi:RHS repeat-associated protein